MKMQEIIEFLIKVLYTPGGCSKYADALSRIIAV